jgi:hypothetical protein
MILSRRLLENKIVKNSLKSDYPPPEVVALTPIFASHREFFLITHTFRAKPRQDITATKGRRFTS